MPIEPPFAQQWHSEDRAEVAELTVTASVLRIGLQSVICIVLPSSVTRPVLAVRSIGSGGRGILGEFRRGKP